MPALAAQADQQGMAGLIDRLIATPWPHASLDDAADTGADRRAA